ncbi:hypothetical protein CDAR_563661 [Caerostris darwini]|uniref:Uncharacterized protein n=1 Tax=Caerostris darwini TaxID=1538125 RepID=A0AAV4VCQ3_9ARAC|nr:hypothetical protein CDAR_563661 [Caerostris darwini]
MECFNASQFHPFNKSEFHLATNVKITTYSEIDQITGTYWMEIGMAMGNVFNQFCRIAVYKCVNVWNGPNDIWTTRRQVRLLFPIHKLVLLTNHNDPKRKTPT